MSELMHQVIAVGVHSLEIQKGATITSKSRVGWLYKPSYTIRFETENVHCFNNIILTL